MLAARTARVVFFCRWRYLGCRVCVTWEVGCATSATFRQRLHVFLLKNEARRRNVELQLPTESADAGEDEGNRHQDTDDEDGDGEEDPAAPPPPSPFEQLLADWYAQAVKRVDLEDFLGGHSLHSNLRSLSKRPDATLQLMVSNMAVGTPAEQFFASFCSAVLHHRQGTAPMEDALDYAGVRLQRVRLRAWAKACGDVHFEENSAKYFPYTVPHQWLRTMEKLQCTSTLMATQLASEADSLEEENRIWAEVHKLGDAPNKKRKLPGFFKAARVKELAGLYGQSSVISPPINRPLYEFVQALLHTKLNICNQVFWRLLKAGAGAYSEVTLVSLRDVLDNNPLLKRVNLAATKEAREVEQELVGHGMHTSLCGADSDALRRELVNILQTFLPVANFVPLPFEAGELDGYAWVEDESGSEDWFDAAVAELDSLLSGWCNSQGYGSTSNYLFRALRRVHDEESYHEVKADYISALPNANGLTALSRFFDGVSNHNRGGTGSWAARGGLGSGWYRCTDFTPRELGLMANHPRVYGQATEFSAGVISTVLCFNDAYALMAVKSAALQSDCSDQLPSVDDEDVADIAGYYRVQDKPIFTESRRGRLWLATTDLFRVRARQFFEALLKSFSPGNNLGLDNLKLKNLVTNYVHLMCEHGDQMMLDVWEHNGLPFGEMTEQSAEAYINIIKEYIRCKEARLQGSEPRLHTKNMKAKTVSMRLSPLMQQIEKQCVRHQTSIQAPKKTVFAVFGEPSNSLVTRRPGRAASKHATIDGVAAVRPHVGVDVKGQIASLKRAAPSHGAATPEWLDTTALSISNMRGGDGYAYLTSLDVSGLDEACVKEQGSKRRATALVVLTGLRASVVRSNRERCAKRRDNSWSRSKAAKLARKARGRKGDGGGWCWTPPGDSEVVAMTPWPWPEGDVQQIPVAQVL